MQISTWGADPVGEVVVDRAQVQVVGLDRAEVAFEVGEVFVGGDGGGRVEAGGGHAGADDVDAIQRGFGGDLGLAAADSQGGVGDRGVEVFGHFEFVDRLAEFDPDPVRAGQPAFGHRRGEGSQRFFGGGQQRVTFAGSFIGQCRVAAGDQPFAGVVGVGDLGQVGLVEQG
jgi:hypothetical protein